MHEVKVPVSRFAVRPESPMSCPLTVTLPTSNPQKLEPGTIEETTSVSMSSFDGSVPLTCRILSSVLFAPVNGRIDDGPYSNFPVVGAWQIE